MFAVIGFFNGRLESHISIVATADTFEEAKKKAYSFALEKVDHDSERVVISEDRGRYEIIEGSLMQYRICDTPWRISVVKLP